MKDQQLSIPSGRGTRETAKRLHRRKLRRVGKKQLDDAPKKNRYRGYT